MTRLPTAVVAAAAFAAVAVLAGGCVEKKTEPAKLLFACETKQCICTEAEIFVWKKSKEVPAEWRSTGEAYCPEGYVLRLAGK